MDTCTRDLRFSPLSRGIYHGLLALMLVVPTYYPAYAAHYFWLLVFLGLGLRPLLEVTGLWRVWHRVESSLVPTPGQRALPGPEDTTPVSSAARQGRVRH
jgi:hypothetical protein